MPTPPSLRHMKRTGADMNEHQVDKYLTAYKGSSLGSRLEPGYTYLAFHSQELRSVCSEERPPNPNTE